MLHGFGPIEIHYTSLCPMRFDYTEASGLISNMTTRILLSSFWASARSLSSFVSRSFNLLISFWLAWKNMHKHFKFTFFTKYFFEIMIESSFYLMSRVRINFKMAIIFLYQKDFYHQSIDILKFRNL